MVLHDGPDSPADRMRGNGRVREVVERYPNSLIIRGHAHWKRPLVELGATQVLNVDARAVICQRAP